MESRFLEPPGETQIGLRNRDSTLTVSVITPKAIRTRAQENKRQILQEL